MKSKGPPDHLLASLPRNGHVVVLKGGLPLLPRRMVGPLPSAGDTCAGARRHRGCIGWPDHRSAAQGVEAYDAARAGAWIHARQG